jgi:hypothetical protein
MLKKMDTFLVGEVYKNPPLLRTVVSVISPYYPTSQQLHSMSKIENYQLKDSIKTNIPLYFSSLPIVEMTDHCLTPFALYFTRNMS